MDYIKISKTLIPDIETQNPYNLKTLQFPTLKGIVRMNSNGDHIKGFVNFSDLLQPSDRSLFPTKIDPNDPANIQFTSGTTGRPKAATLSHHNILNNAYLIGNKCRYT
jgi:fatty-acyl-CoA synthase